MIQPRSAPTATVLRFTPREVASPGADAPRLTDAELHRAIARGRRLHAEAVRHGFRWVFRQIFAGTAARSLRGQRHARRCQPLRSAEV